MPGIGDNNVSMLILLNQDWLWIIVGVILVTWGILSLQLDFKQWVKIASSLFFNNFTENTKKEKRELASAPIDEVVASNAGCMLILIGLTSLIVGGIRLLR